MNLSNTSRDSGVLYMLIRLYFTSSDGVSLLSSGKNKLISFLACFKPF